MIDQNENLPYHFNLILSQQQKLLIIQQLLQQLKPKLPLDVQQEKLPIQINQQMQYHQPIHYYEVMGNKFRRKTQMNNLVQKLKYMKQYGDQNSPVQSEQQSNSKFQGRDQQEIRYFNSNVRCFRCKKIGHFNNQCPQQFFCIYCLSFKHPVDKCPQKVVCFRCYKFGHVINECPQSQPSYCQTCKRKHRHKCNFLTKGIDQIKQIFNCEYLQRQKEIICIACNQTGHLNCKWTPQYI